MHRDVVAVLAYILPRIQAHGESAETATCDRVDQELYEKLVVLEPNTATYPRAVVVHFEDAGIAEGAVMRPWWLDLVALFTPSVRDVVHVGNRHAPIVGWNLVSLSQTRSDEVALGSAIGGDQRPVRLRPRRLMVDHVHLDISL